MEKIKRDSKKNKPDKDWRSKKHLLKRCKKIKFSRIVQLI